MSRRKKSHPGAIVLLIISSVTAFACTRGQAFQEKTVRIPVTLAEVEKKEIARPIHTYGRLAAKKEVKLSFKTGGIIRTLAAEEGQIIEKGQLLARLDLEEIAAQVKMTESGFEKARRDADRVQNLFRDKAATLEQFQDVQTALQVAESQKRAAEFNLRFSEIRAPARGRILKRVMEENEMVGPGMPVFLFASVDREWVVRAGVADRDLMRLKLGDKAEIFLDTFPGVSLPAVISELAEGPDPYTGAYEVELTLKAGERRMVSGLVAKVDLFPGDRRFYALIPVSSLVRVDGEMGRVFIPEPDGKRARAKTVRIGFLYDNRVAVVSGLEDIAQVVAEGAAFLEDQAAIEIGSAPALKNTAGKNR